MNGYSKIRRWLWTVAVCMAGVLGAWPAEAQVKRLLIVGDSWAASIATIQHDGPGFGSLDAVLTSSGLGGYASEGEETAWGGRKASDWASLSYRTILTQELQNQPAIDIVYLIIGGNDFLALAANGVNIMSYTETQRSAFWDTIQANIQTIVNHCLAQRPNIKVLISDYDYLDGAKAEALLGFDFGGATPRQVNDAFIELGQRKLTIAQNTDRCGYVSNWGVLQHEYNDPAPGLPEPGGPPGYTPYAGGDPDAVMPVAAHLGDGIHPTDQAHRYMIQRSVDPFLRGWLLWGDSDLDGLRDYDETRDLDPGLPGAQNPFQYDQADVTGNNGTLAPDGKPDGENDYDGDGYSNALELALGSNPINSSESLPMHPDGACLLFLMVLAAGICRMRAGIRRGAV